jgi:sulfite reductase alpha subunit-like flavoprotein
MLKIIPAIAFIVLAALQPAARADDDIAQRAAAVRETVKQTQAALLQELLAALKKGGPELAIHSCNVKAITVAKEAAQMQHMIIRRTSLKLRNLQDAPDDWEKQTLNSFEQRVKQGENPAQMEHYEIVKKGNAKVFRYMKAIAIPKDGPCLICHGQNIDPALHTKIKGRYPGDEATGFKEGDLRGAFSVRQRL